jgi:hypothetical protein
VRVRGERGKKGGWQKKFYLGLFKGNILVTFKEDKIVLRGNKPFSMD